MSIENYNEDKKIYADVSVIIPCFNCSETIERAAESVRNQSLIPKELILVDDFSNDDGKTRSKILKLKNQYGSEWLRPVLLNKNSGPGSARNAGWNIATSKYIAFLDADDTWDLKKIECQYKIMKLREDLDITGHKCISYKSNNDNIDKPIKFINPHISLNQMLISNRIATRTVMLKKNIPLRFSNLYYSEDRLLWCELIHAGYHAAVFDSALAYTFPSNKPTLSSNLLAMEKGELFVLKQLYKKQMIGKFKLIISEILSIIKYCKRCLVSNIRRNHE